MTYADDDSMDFEAIDPYAFDGPVDDDDVDYGDDDGFGDGYDGDAEADAWHSQYDDDPNPYHGDYYEDDGY